MSKVWKSTAYGRGRLARAVPFLSLRLPLWGPAGLPFSRVRRAVYEFQFPYGFAFSPEFARDRTIRG